MAFLPLIYDDSMRSNVYIQWFAGNVTVLRELCLRGVFYGGVGGGAQRRSQQQLLCENSKEFF